MSDPAGVDNVVLSELQLLLSMYTHKTQVRFDDPELTELVEQYLAAELDDNCLSALEEALRSSISFSVKPQDDLEIQIRIPAGYPKTERISATCSSRVKDDEYLARLNADLRSMIQTSSLNGLIEGDESESGASSNYCDILSVINYCQEYLEDRRLISDGLRVSVAESQNDPSQSSPSASSARIWIYSHHIYNTKKRKFLVDTASELSLNGFSMPGKPGFICVEGDEGACDEYWSRVRQLTWQRISLITKQNLNNSTECCFKTFEELRLTKSDFIKYLDEKQISHVIKEYLNF